MFIMVDLQQVRLLWLKPLLNLHMQVAFPFCVGHGRGQIRLWCGATYIFHDSHWRRFIVGEG